MKNADLNLQIMQLQGEIQRQSEEMARLRRKLDALRAENEEIEQILGKALGYPPFPINAGWDYSTDPPSPTSAPDSEWVCTGDHVTATLAEEARRKIACLTRQLERLPSDFQDSLARAEQAVSTTHR